MPNPILREEVVVGLENGLHLVPCSQISRALQGVDCQARIYNGDKSVDAKSVLDLMTLNAECGTKLVVETSGTDAGQAMERITQLFATNFPVEESGSESPSE